MPYCVKCCIKMPVSGFMCEKCTAELKPLDTSVTHTASDHLVRGTDSIGAKPKPSPLLLWVAICVMGTVFAGILITTSLARQKLHPDGGQIRPITIAASSPATSPAVEPGAQAMVLSVHSEVHQDPQIEPSPFSPVSNQESTIQYNEQMRTNHTDPYSAYARYPGIDAQIRSIYSQAEGDYTQLVGGDYDQVPHKQFDYTRNGFILSVSQFADEIGTLLSSGKCDPARRSQYLQAQTTIIRWMYAMKAYTPSTTHR